jgi:small subunit ribosomal protein S18
MSEELTPQEETQEAPQEASQAETPVPAEAPVSMPPGRSDAPSGRSGSPVGRSESYDDSDDDGDDLDDDIDDDDDVDDDDSDGARVEGPAEYVLREKSGRGRRVGNEVRPDDVDYKNIPLLSRFLDRRGRILSRRKTRVSAKVQRRIVRAIKRARHLALLPYTGDHTRIVRRRR